MIGQYLQSSDDLSILDAEELTDSFRAYDENNDGLLGREEFACRQLARSNNYAPLRSPEGKALLDGIDPWEGLVHALDTDSDGSIAQGELLAFFEERAGGAPWIFPNEDQVQSQLRSQRPLEGKRAPDFHLQDMHGNTSVTLSSFRGDLPVALIFGSYT